MDFEKLSIESLMDCINNGDFKVKTPPHNKVKDEFNKFINKEITNRRNISTISNMRKFHNHIKQTMIINIVNKYKSDKKLKKKPVLNLLDIAVGRGGDMFKWNMAGISNVFGFDKSSDSINSINPFNQGAKERLAKNPIDVNIEYHVGNAMEPTPELITNLINFTNKIGNNYNCIDFISCQFALHYFFKDTGYLDNIFKTFLPFLKSGGYFFGTSTNGENIKKLIKSKVESNLFEITPQKNSYKFKINDSFDQGNYFNTIDESIEYYTNFKTLIDVASKYGLKPVYLNFFESKNEYPYYTINYSNQNPSFPSFEDIYNLKNHGNWVDKKTKQSFSLTDDEMLLNSIYSTFCFQKN